MLLAPFAFSQIRIAGREERDTKNCASTFTISNIRRVFFFKHPATPEIYTLSLHDALPISSGSASPRPGDPKRVPDRSIGREFRPPESRSASRQIRATCEFRPVITRIAGSRLGGGGRRGGLGWR